MSNVTGTVVVHPQGPFEKEAYYICVKLSEYKPLPKGFDVGVRVSISLEEK